MPGDDVEAMESADPTSVVLDGMFNRYLDAPLEARPNEPIRLWVMNGGPTLTNAFHVIGALFDRTYADGNPANTQYGLQTYNVPPGAGAMFELRIPDAGLSPFVTRSFAYTGLRAVGVIRVANDAAAPPAGYPAIGDPFTAGVLPFGSTPGLVEAGECESSGTPEGPVVVTAAITGFDPGTIEAAAGEVELEITNLDAFDHDVTIDELGVNVAFGANETVDAASEAGPGTYTFDCSIPGHREAGMEGTLTVMASGH